MPKLPQISGREAVKAFGKIGYQVVRKRGSHFRLHHPHRKPLTIPDHRMIGKGLLRRLLRDADISTKDFLKLIKK